MFSKIAGIVFVSIFLSGTGGFNLSADSPANTTAAKPPAPPDPFEILTPPVAETPRINGPQIFGVRPGSPFLYAVPVSGKRPITYSAQNLPAGLSLNSASGLITGTLGTPATYDVTLAARNELGSAQKKFRIVVGDELALTPPMGWSSWNCYFGGIDQQKIMAQAHGLVNAGLNQHGFTYINIDDAWQGRRGGKFNGIQPNLQRFPDIKAMIDEIHGLGLKAGIYSTPWITSYDRHAGGSSRNPEGSWDDSLKGPDASGKNSPFAIGLYHFFRQDAEQWGDWGFDYLKFDWNPNEVPETKEMAEALRASGRDFVYSLSNSTPFGNIKELAPLCNLWRISGDIRDSWDSLKNNGFNQDKWAPYQKPGHYNDPDMMVVGVVFGHRSNLTSNEQYTHVSLWCLLSAPLILGCDLTKCDAFTLNLLTNDEVLDIDQDILCKQATVIAHEANTLVYAKPLADGAVAVGLFNIGEQAATVSANWKDLGLNGRHIVRDLWRQKDLGAFDASFSTPVPAHGVVLVKIQPAS